MSAAPDAFTVRRVLVAIDPGASVADVFETAVALAVRCDADLLGLVLEDERLIQLAGSPLLRQLSLSAESLPVDPIELEAQVKAVAAQAERRLAAVVAVTRPELSFRTVRTGRLPAPPASREDEELLVLSDESRPVTRYAALASPLRAVAEQARLSVLLFRRRGLLSRPVLFACDAVAGVDRTIGAAAWFAETSGSLMVLLPASSAATEEWIQARIGGREGISVRVHHLPAVDLEHLTPIAAQDYGIVVLSGASALAEGRRFGELIDRLRCALLVVR